MKAKETTLEGVVAYQGGPEEGKQHIGSNPVQLRHTAQQAAHHCARIMPFSP